MTHQEGWLNGNTRRGSFIYTLNATCCAGCGKVVGISSVSISEEDIGAPVVYPDYPFPLGDCPVCGYNDYRTVDEALRTATLGELRREIERKKMLSTRDACFDLFFELFKDDAQTIYSLRIFLDGSGGIDKLNIRTAQEDEVISFKSFEELYEKLIELTD